ncbi:MAG: helix-turn-helix domain-containing protein [Candidatus Omnitrophota bacterium]
MKKIIYKIISSILIVTFFAQDILWADPEIIKDGYSLQVQSKFLPSNPEIFHKGLIEIPLKYIIESTDIGTFNLRLMPRVYEGVEVILDFSPADLSIGKSTGKYKDGDNWIVPCFVGDVEGRYTWAYEAVVAPDRSFEVKRAPERAHPPAADNDLDEDAEAWLGTTFVYMMLDVSKLPAGQDEVAQELLGILDEETSAGIGSEERKDAIRARLAGHFYARRTEIEERLYGPVRKDLRDRAGSIASGLEGEGPDAIDRAGRFLAEYDALDASVKTPGLDRQVESLRMLLNSAIQREERAERLKEVLKKVSREDILVVVRQSGSEIGERMGRRKLAKLARRFGITPGDIFRAANHYLIQDADAILERLRAPTDETIAGARDFMKEMSGMPFSVEDPELSRRFINIRRILGDFAEMERRREEEAVNAERRQRALEEKLREDARRAAHIEDLKLAISIGSLTGALTSTGGDLARTAKELKSTVPDIMLLVDSYGLNDALEAIRTRARAESETREREDTRRGLLELMETLRSPRKEISPAYLARFLEPLRRMPGGSLNALAAEAGIDTAAFDALLATYRDRYRKAFPERAPGAGEPSRQDRISGRTVRERSFDIEYVGPNNPRYAIVRKSATGIIGAGVEEEVDGSGMITIDLQILILGVLYKAVENSVDGIFERANHEEDTDRLFRDAIRFRILRDERNGLVHFMLEDKGKGIPAEVLAAWMRDDFPMTTKDQSSGLTQGGDGRAVGEALRICAECGFAISFITRTADDNGYEFIQEPDGSRRLLERHVEDAGTSVVITVKASGPARGAGRRLKEIVWPEEPKTAGSDRAQAINDWTAYFVRSLDIAASLDHQNIWTYKLKETGEVVKAEESFLKWITHNARNHLGFLSDDTLSFEARAERAKEAFGKIAAEDSFAFLRSLTGKEIGEIVPGEVVHAGTEKDPMLRTELSNFFSGRVLLCEGGAENLAILKEVFGRMEKAMAKIAEISGPGNGGRPSHPALIIGIIAMMILPYILENLFPGLFAGNGPAAMAAMLPILPMLVYGRSDKTDISKEDRSWLPGSPEDPIMERWRMLVDEIINTESLNEWARQKGQRPNTVRSYIDRIPVLRRMLARARKANPLKLWVSGKPGQSTGERLNLFIKEILMAGSVAAWAREHGRDPSGVQTFVESYEGLRERVYSALLRPWFPGRLDQSPEERIKIFHAEVRKEGSVSAWARNHGIRDPGIVYSFMKNHPETAIPEEKIPDRTIIERSVNNKTIGPFTYTKLLTYMKHLEECGIEGLEGLEIRYGSSKLTIFARTRKGRGVLLRETHQILLGDDLRPKGVDGNMMSISRVIEKQGAPVMIPVYPEIEGFGYKIVDYRIRSFLEHLGLRSTEVVAFRYTGDGEPNRRIEICMKKKGFMRKGELITVIDLDEDGFPVGVPKPAMPDPGQRIRVNLLKLQIKRGKIDAEVYPMTRSASIVQNVINIGGVEYIGLQTYISYLARKGTADISGLDFVKVSKDRVDIFAVCSKDGVETRTKTHSIILDEDGLPENRPAENNSERYYLMDILRRQGNDLGYSVPARRDSWPLERTLEAIRERERAGLPLNPGFLRNRKADEGGDVGLWGAMKKHGLLDRYRLHATGGRRIEPVPGPIALYRGSVMRYGELSQEEAEALWRRMAWGDDQARVELANGLSRLVVMWLEDDSVFGMDLSRSTEWNEDVLSTANETILEELERSKNDSDPLAWDGEPDTLFSFLINRIRGAIKWARKERYEEKAVERTAVRLDALQYSNKSNGPTKRTGHEGIEAAADITRYHPDEIGRILSPDGINGLDRALAERDAESAGEGIIMPDEKDELAARIKALLIEKGIPGKIGRLLHKPFAVYMVGSMGRFKPARHHLSDVNLVLVIDNDNDNIEEVLRVLQNEIGGRVAYQDDASLPILLLGKNGRYDIDKAGGNGFISLLEMFGIGSPDPEIGFASIEVVPLSSGYIEGRIYDLMRSEYGEEEIEEGIIAEARSIRRLAFHVLEPERYRGAGPNARLIYESAQDVSNMFKRRLEVAFSTYRDRFDSETTEYFENKLLRDRPYVSVYPEILSARPVLAAVIGTVALLALQYILESIFPGEGPVAMAGMLPLVPLLLMGGAKPNAGNKFKKAGDGSIYLAGFGERLKRVREAQGLSQEELSFLMDGAVTQLQISRWENEQLTPPPAALLGAMSEILGVPPDYIRLDEDSVDREALRKRGDIGGRVKMVRGLFGLSPMEANRELGVSGTNYLRYVENGRRPTLSYISRFAELFRHEVSVRYLLTGIDEPRWETVGVVAGWGERIDKVIMKLNINRAELSKKMRIRTTRLKQMIKGDIRPSVLQLESMASYCGVPAGYLVKNGTEPEWDMLKKEGDEAHSPSVKDVERPEKGPDAPERVTVKPGDISASIGHFRYTGMRAYINYLIECGLGDLEGIELVRLGRKVEVYGLINMGGHIKYEYLNEILLAPDLAPEGITIGERRELSILPVLERQGVPLMVPISGKSESFGVNGVEYKAGSFFRHLGILSGEAVAFKYLKEGSLDKRIEIRRKTAGLKPVGEILTTVDLDMDGYPSGVPGESIAQGNAVSVLDLQMRRNKHMSEHWRLRRRLSVGDKEVWFDGRGGICYRGIEAYLNYLNRTGVKEIAGIEMVKRYGKSVEIFALINTKNGLASEKMHTIILGDDDLPASCASSGERIFFSILDVLEWQDNPIELSLSSPQFYQDFALGRVDYYGLGELLEFKGVPREDVRVYKRCGADRDEHLIEVHKDSFKGDLVFRILLDTADRPKFLDEKAVSADIAELLHGQGDMDDEEFEGYIRYRERSRRAKRDSAMLRKRIDALAIAVAAQDKGLFSRARREILSAEGLAGDTVRAIMSALGAPYFSGINGNGGYAIRRLIEESARRFGITGDLPGRRPIYTGEKAEQMLAAMPDTEKTPHLLKTTNGALYAAAKRHNIPLPTVSEIRRREVEARSRRTQMDRRPLGAPGALYRAHVMRYELLSEEEAESLWRRMAEGDERARVMLANGLSRLVVEWLGDESFLSIDISRSNEYNESVLSMANETIVTELNRGPADPERWSGAQGTLYGFLMSRVRGSVNFVRREIFLRNRLSAMTRSLDHPMRSVKDNEPTGRFAGESVAVTDSAVWEEPGVVDRLLTPDGLKALEEELDERDVEAGGDDVFTREDKDKLAANLRQLFIKKEVPERLNMLFGKPYAIYMVGSMGHFKVARRDQSDLNLVLAVDADMSKLEEALRIMREAVGGAVLYQRHTSLPVLLVGKFGHYYADRAAGNGFISLLDLFHIGNPDNGFASIEVVSFSPEYIRLHMEEYVRFREMEEDHHDGDEYYDEEDYETLAGAESDVEEREYRRKIGNARALMRLGFHILEPERYYGAGPNARLVFESSENAGRMIEGQLTDAFLPYREAFDEFSTRYFEERILGMGRKIRSPHAAMTATEVTQAPNTVAAVSVQPVPQATAVEKTEATVKRPDIGTRLKEAMKDGARNEVARLLDLLEKKRASREKSGEQMPSHLTRNIESAERFLKEHSVFTAAVSVLFLLALQHILKGLFPGDGTVAMASMLPLVPLLLMGGVKKDKRARAPDGKPVSAYPTRRSAEKELLSRARRGLSNTPTALQRVKENGGDETLYVAVRKFGITLPSERTKKYASKSAVMRELKRRAGAGLANNHAALHKPMAEGGDSSLLGAVKRFEVKLPKEPSGTLPSYRTKEEVVAALADRERRGLANTIIALKSRVRDGGDTGLLAAARRFGVPIRKMNRIRYKTKKEVYAEFKRRLERGLANNAEALVAGIDKGGDVALRRAAERLGIELPSGAKPKKYSSKRSVEEELARRGSAGLPNNPAALSRRADEGGDAVLLYAAEEFGVALPMLHKHGYASRRETVKVLRERARLGLSSNAAALQASDEEGGDRALYKAAMKFGVKLPRVSLQKYRTKNETRAELDARAKRGLESTSSALTKRAEEGGDPALLTAAKRFGITLPQGRSGTPSRYQSREEAEAELARREARGQQNNPQALWADVEDGGDHPLREAARKFGIELPAGYKSSRYGTREAVETELERRNDEGLANNPQALNTRGDEGGDSLLLKAARKFGVALPVLVKNSRYTTKASVDEELVAREERGLRNNVGTLQMAYSGGGDKALLRAARKFGVGLPGGRTGKELKYKTKEEAEAELARRSSEGLANNPKALGSAGGDQGLLKASRRFGIELPRIRLISPYTGKEDVEAQLRRRGSQGMSNTAVALQQPKERGGDWQLYKAAKRYGVGLVRPTRRTVYTTPADVIAAIARREAEGLASNQKALRAKKRDGGDTGLLYAARRFKIPLPRGRVDPEYGRRVSDTTYHQLLPSGKELTEEAAVALWHKMQTGDEGARTRLMAGLMRFGFAFVEKELSYDLRIRSDANDTVVGAIALVIVEEAHNWDDSSEPSLYRFLKEKFREYVQKERARSYKGRPFGASSLQDGMERHDGRGEGRRALREERIGTVAMGPARQLEEVENFMAPEGDALRRLETELDARGRDALGDAAMTGEEKDMLASDLRDFFGRKDIARILRDELGIGEFTIYLVGSMGRFGRAAHDQSDANLLLVADAEPDELEEALVILREMIGGYIDYHVETDIPVLLVGKNGTYDDAVASGNGFIHILLSHRVGNPENGLASLEVVPLSRPYLQNVMEVYDTLLEDRAPYFIGAEEARQAAGNAHALMRLGTHTLHRYHDIGPNARLVFESNEGIAQRLTARLISSITGRSFFEFAKYYFQKFMFEQGLKGAGATAGFAHPVLLAGVVLIGAAVSFVIAHLTGHPAADPMAAMLPIVPFLVGTIQPVAPIGPSSAVGAHLSAELQAAQRAAEEAAKARRGKEEEEAARKVETTVQPVAPSVPPLFYDKRGSPVLPVRTAPPAGYYLSRDMSAPEGLAKSFVEAIADYMLKKKLVLAFVDGVGGRQYVNPIGLIEALEDLKRDPDYEKILQNLEIVRSGPKNMKLKLEGHIEEGAEVFIFSPSTDEAREETEKIRGERVRSVYIDDSGLSGNEYYPLLEMIAVTLKKAGDHSRILAMADVLRDFYIMPEESADGRLIFRLLPPSKRHDTQELILYYAHLKELIRNA